MRSTPSRRQAASRVKGRRNRVTRQHPRRLPGGRIAMVRRKSGCRSGRIRKRTAFPRPVSVRVPQRIVPPSATQASAWPGGCQAPAMGGTGAGRGLWPPAGLGQGSAWPGRWPRSDCAGHVEGFPGFASGHPWGRTFSAPCQRQAPAPPCAPAPGQNLNRPPTKTADARSNSVSGSE
jgi:hypothetical protein